MYYERKMPYEKIIKLIVSETCKIKESQLIYLKGPLEYYNFLRGLSQACFKAGARVDRFEVVDYLYGYDMHKEGKKTAFLTLPKVKFSTFDNIDWFIEIQPNYYYPKLTPKIEKNKKADEMVSKGWDGWFGRLTSHNGRFLYINLPTQALAKRLNKDPDDFDFLFRALEISPSSLLLTANKYLKMLTGKKRLELVDKKNDYKIKMELGTRKWIKSCGNFDKNKYLFALPGGEIYIAPIEDRTNGELFIEKISVHQEIIEGLYLKVKNGKIIKFVTKKGGVMLAERIKKLKNYDIIGEFGIGFNPFIKLCGSYATDEKAQGTCHFGIGRNVMYGGKIECQQHTDLIKDLRGCELYADDELVLKDSKIVGKE
jgi:leucyl aminopeptidase (aminopeptidase T)